MIPASGERAQLPDSSLSDNRTSMKAASASPDPPNSVDTLLGLRLGGAMEWFIQSVQLSGSGAGLRAMSTAQAMLLGHMAMGEHRPARLARSMGMSRQAVSVLVAQLTREGVLTTTPDPVDRRAIRVEFAPEHALQRDAVVRILRALEQRLGEIIGHDRLAVLRQALAMDWGPPIELDAKALGIAPVSRKRK